MLNMNLKEWEVAWKSKKLALDLASVYATREGKHSFDK